MPLEAPRPAEDAASPAPRPSLIDTYRSRYASLVRLAYALTGSQSLAEDVVHDVFVRAHQRWKQIDNTNAYLRVAVVNGCRSAARRAARERAALTKEPAEYAVLDADEMFDALDHLPYRQRAAIVLHFYGGLSYKDVAEMLQCREGTVASLVHRGLGRLRQVIER